MLQKIETQEIMTKRAAMKRYRTQYFMMVVTEVVDKGDNDLGYVIYAADSQRELTSIRREEYIEMPIALMQGGAAEPYPSVGNAVYYE